MIGRVFNLSSLNGDNGVILNGIAPVYYAGWSVSSAGDFNGDGYDDILVGAGPPENKRHADQVYLIYGNSTLSSPFGLSSLNGSKGVIFNGVVTGHSAGSYVSSAGDFNGDGLNDILISAPSTWGGGKKGSVGQVHVVYGNRALSSPFELSSLNGSNGVTFNGIDAGDGAGWSVSSAGDFNGDGVADILIGAYRANVGGCYQAGQVYLIYGNRAFTSHFKLSSLNGSNGVIFNGIDAGDGAGYSVSSAGDFNGDGYDDILIGTSSGSSKPSSDYVLYGNSTLSSPFELSSLDGSNGIIFNGIATGDNAGSSVSSAGDFNGDGYDDILIGTPSGSKSTAGYVLYGNSSFTSPFELSSLDGSNGIIFNRIATDDLAGCAVSSAGDINSDGFQDILIGAKSASPGGRFHAGQAYVLYGNSSFTSPFELSSLDGSNGIIFNGIATGDNAGSSVSSAGDFNGDGYDDILIGAPLVDPTGRSNGQAYVVYTESLVENFTYSNEELGIAVLGNNSSNIVDELT